MPEQNNNPTVTIDANLSQEKRDMHPLLKYVGLPIGFVGMAAAAFNYFMTKDEATTEFFQREFLQTMQASTVAATKQAEASEDVTKIMGRVADELDDFSKASMEQNRRIDKIIEQQWRTIGERAAEKAGE